MQSRASPLLWVAYALYGEQHAGSRGRSNTGIVSCQTVFTETDADAMLDDARRIVHETYHGAYDVGSILAFGIMKRSRVDPFIGW